MCKPLVNGLLSYMVGTFLERIHHFSSPKKSPVSKSRRGFLNKLDNDITPSSRVGHVLRTYKDLKFHLIPQVATLTLLKDTLKDEKSWITIELDGYYKVCKIDERDEKVPTFKSIAAIGFKTQNREVNPSKSQQQTQQQTQQQQQAQQQQHPQHTSTTHSNFDEELEQQQQQQQQAQQQQQQFQFQYQHQYQHQHQHQNNQQHKKEGML
ncbi:hypothetical protein DICPUDRAFT_81385 [Dictyostelium purpureum]|uniref:Uncharacterized protein n=1 Tax=Dictyostelium purpureum TaxID=5786 RepID=F0ZTB6_DICPU|nr:uncharacterized protein DICPUDRAFT_81385 [Dictyostelium purpureum]EGC32808.1 hypothetical protein DICPUDRAFT_81385 [Dictyostelium purpureum]|eukprot:XP_003290666.1 hypothetical protein DICPUDRAFT_81385 [Dictyostelium purpureum]